MPSVTEKTKSAATATDAVHAMNTTKRIQRSLLTCSSRTSYGYGCADRLPRPFHGARASTFLSVGAKDHCFFDARIPHAPAPARSAAKDRSDLRRGWVRQRVEVSWFLRKRKLRRSVPQCGS